MGEYTQVVESLYKAFYLVLCTVFTAVLIPWLKRTVYPWLEDKRLMGLVRQFVMAAEKLASTGEIDKSHKKSYVVKLLTSHGIEVNSRMDAFIEGAVEELDLAAQTAVTKLRETLDEYLFDYDERDELAMGDACQDEEPGGFYGEE